MNAERSVWIATANLKELMVEDARARPGRRRTARGGEYRSVLQIFDELVGQGVEIRILHASPPSRPFREELRRCAGRARRHLGVRPAPDAEDPALCPDVVLRRSRTQPRLGLADNSERWTVQGKWPRPLWVPGSRALAPGASSTPAGRLRRRRFSK